MPNPAKPQPRDDRVPGAVHYRREYRDALGRPMDGAVTFIGRRRIPLDGQVILPAPVTVDVVNGAVDTWLPADTYVTTANLRTRDGQRVTDQESITLE